MTKFGVLLAGLLLIAGCQSAGERKAAEEFAAKQAEWERVKASPPDPPRPPIRAALAEGASKEPALKPTVSSFRKWFEDLGIGFQASTAVRGTPRMTGTHPDKLTSVELIGFGEKLERTSVMFGLAKDAPAAMIRNTGVIMVFMRETGWEKGWKWATEAIGKGRVKKRHEKVDYVMQTIGDTGICVLSATPVGASSNDD